MCFVEHSNNPKSVMSSHWDKALQKDNLNEALKQ